MRTVGKNKHPVTPDGRYFVVDATLWRMSNPALSSKQRAKLVTELMDARRAIKSAEKPEIEQAARERVHAAKIALGERGPVWWNDGAPDYNQKKVVGTPYSEWFMGLNESR